MVTKIMSVHHEKMHYKYIVKLVDNINSVGTTNHNQISLSLTSSRTVTFCARFNFIDCNDYKSVRSKNFICVSLMFSLSRLVKL